MKPKQKLDDLTCSIDEVGLIHAISIVEENGVYSLVDGQHRLLAYKQALQEEIHPATGGHRIISTERKYPVEPKEYGVNLPVGRVHLSPFHFRKETADERLDDLAQSIR